MRSEIAQEALDELVAGARAARAHAYAPYSGFSVGAALIGDEDRIFTGVNVENASYGLAICAERAALANAVANGHRRIRAIAIAGPDGATVPPCGACRQVLYEFNPAMIVVYTTPGGVAKTTLNELLPESFGPDNLT